MKVVLNKLGVFELQYDILFAETRRKDIADDKMSSRYLPELSRSLYIWYMKFGHLMTKNAEMFPMLECLNENLVNGKDLGIRNLNSEVLYASRASFVVLLKEAADFYINNPLKSTVVHATSLCRFGEHVLQILNHLYDKFNESFKASSIAVMN